MNILVTGGAGFIGSNLVHALSGEHDVRVIDNLDGGKRKNLAGVEHTFHREDICDSIIRGVDVIYHLACRKMIDSIKQPEIDLKINTMGTLNVLENARKLDASVVFTSTGSIYGNPTVFPTSEDYPPHPESPYGVSKWAGEEYCKLYHKLYGLNVVIARPFSVYGPRQQSIGVIPKFIKQTLEAKPMTIEGTGVQSRAFTYVDDFVEALILLNEKGVSGKAYNIASDCSYPILMLHKMIADLLGDYGIETIPRKKGDLDFSYPSTEKIKALGWKQKTPLDIGIRKTSEWLKNHVNNV